MAAHLETVVKAGLARFGEHITRVEAHVTDAHSRSKPNPDEIHCTLEARLVGQEPVIVKDHASNAHQAIHIGAAQRSNVRSTLRWKNADSRPQRIDTDRSCDPIRSTTSRTDAS